jgi:hypothetical protein
MDRYARHDHVVVLREKIDEEPVMRRVPSKDGWHWDDEVWYTRPIFKRWSVVVPCTLDIPEEGVSVWRKKARNKTNEDKLTEKNCFWWLEYYPNVANGNSGYKRLTNQAVRSKVKQQLHNAVRDYGYDWEDGDWDDVDVFVDSKHQSAGWWY